MAEYDSKHSSPDYKKLWEQANAEREKAEEGRARAEEELDQARSDTQQTSFAEFIKGCHFHLSRPIRVQTTDWSTRESLTSPAGRLCPTHLRFWNDFHSLQRDVYTKVLNLLEPADKRSPRLFSFRLALESLGRELHLRLLTSEADLQSYARFAVENQVHQIFVALKSNPGMLDHLPALGDIWFDNHANTLNASLGPRSSRGGDKPTRSNTDQFCVHRTVDGKNSLLTIVEYKPSGKLPPEQIRAGFRDMGVWQDVVQLSAVPTDREERLQYIAQLRVATVAAQVHDSMIKDGVAYACMTTGSVQVFFHVPENDPETLKYFVAEPNLDCESSGSEENWAREPVTAVGRMLALCLMSLTTPVRSQAWRNEAISRMKRWTVDVQQILAGVSDDDLQSNPSGSEYFPSSPLGSSPASRGPSLRSRSSCQDGMTSPPPSDDSDTDRPPHDEQGQKRRRSLLLSSPTPEQARPRAKRPTQQPSRGPQEETETLDYCSQRCLLGLRNHGELDNQCPNYERHRCFQSTDRHLISLAQFTDALKEQLDKSLDSHITPCGTPDSGGVPLRLSLMPYGYTVVGKGTPDELQHRTRREAEVYGVLRSCQGKAIPVFLGTINLHLVYFVHPGVCIKHMILLSWAGEPVRPWQNKVWESVNRAKRALARYHIRHQGFSEPNSTMWNPEFERVQLVNLHSVTLSPPILRTLDQKGRKRSSSVAMENPSQKQFRVH
jgi:hypothetical protein